MTPAEFLATLWPKQGHYVVATPFTIPDTNKRVYAHKVFTSILEAEVFIDAQKHNKDIYFAIHTVKEPKVWNPDKLNLKTGEKGAFEVRVQRNMASARCFFFDIDVDANNEKKYKSQSEAITNLKQFCTALSLPKPMIVSSGGGLHVYWRLTDPLESQEWQVHAAKLKYLATQHKLKIDPSRVTDTSSVLRVAGTYNFKKEPRKVTVLTQGVETDTEKFLQLLNNALPDSPPKSYDLGANTASTYPDTPVSFKALVTACPQMQQVVRVRGNVSEPVWYHSLNLIRFVDNAQKFIHLASSGHPEYDFEETEQKVAQLEAKMVGPTTCAKYAEVCGEAACLSCQYYGKVKSPLVAARYKDIAPPPTVESTVLPEPKPPYKRLKGKGVIIETKNKDGEITTIPVFEYDIYPIRRISNATEGYEKQTWRVELPHKPVEFSIDADALYDTKKLLNSLSNRGVYPSPEQIEHLRRYMIAYIKTLQERHDAEPQYNHFGWSDDRTQFILPDKILGADGSIKPVQLATNAQRASIAISKKGTFEKQLELLQFYKSRSYIANQFCILASLGAPLFYATGHHGVIINMSGPPGASKSTTLYTAASLWGSPELYTLNGTNSGATAKARYERISTLANLPICVDEITHMQGKDIADLAMSITQPGHRLRLASDGTEKRTPDSYKATILLTTANTSLYTLLSSDRQDSTAESMRVMEIRFAQNMIHSKHEADAFLYDLKQNYGHIGEKFISYVVKHRAVVEDRIRQVVRELDREVNTTASERFWSAASAVVLVAGEIANELGLLDYNVAQIRHWLIKEQFPAMRGVIVEQYSSAVAILTEYMEQIQGDIIVVNSHKDGNIPTLIRPPQRQLLAHYDWATKRMWILKKPFRDYCTKIGANYTTIMEDLNRPRFDPKDKPTRVVPLVHTRKTLGAGTEYAKGQSWCFMVDMEHPEISGMPSLTVVENIVPPELQKVKLR